QVLLKAKKLFPYQLDDIRRRFEFAIRSIQVDVLSRKLRAMEKGASAAELTALDKELEERRSELDSAFAMIVAANEPTVLQGGVFDKLEAIARDTFADLYGTVHPLLRPQEVQSLSVARGSLTTSEIEEIRSHVTHTFQFLSQIPWGKQFRRVAIIAGSH